ncbi:class I SAM-dependent methyltransferase [Pendulispora rubella]|uniref:Class I SAM-dependent methyltransferase n=1 Tax=Pendulispora rubella TaxID=2741070 RepID=A0ABZ2LFP9_9BACT
MPYDRFRRAFRTLRTFGGVDTLLAAIASYALQIPARRGNAFDASFGIETTEPVAVTPRDFVDGSHASAIWYFPSLPEVFASVMRTLDVRAEDFTFVDIGCGKGRVLVMAGQWPFRQVLGVEASTAVSRVARKNLGKVASRTAMGVITGNALSFEMPPGDLLLYLYNPFSKFEAYVEFLRHLEDSLRREPRRVVLVYVCPVHVKAFDECHFLRPLERYELLVSDYTWHAFTNTKYVPRSNC